MSRISLPPSVRNPLSAWGALVAIIAMVLGAILLTVHYFETDHNAYFGIFVFMVVPAFLFAGLFAIPIGALRERRRRQRGGAADEPLWPVWDLNKRSYRHALAIFAVGTVVMITLSALGSYGAYHYSESVEFCGTTCHEVMEPEYTTYQNIAARARRLRRVPHRLGRRLVRQVEALGRLPGLRRARRQVPAADPDPDREPAPGAGDLRAVPLAGASSSARS